MERLERFYKIEQLLKNRRPVSFSALRFSLGVSAATLKRDLEYMKNRFNAPIEYDRETNGYRFGRPRTGPRYELPGLWFNAGEAYARRCRSACAPSSAASRRVRTSRSASASSSPSAAMRPRRSSAWSPPQF